MGTDTITYRVRIGLFAASVRPKRCSNNKSTGSKSGTFKLHVEETMAVMFALFLLHGIVCDAPNTGASCLGRARPLRTASKTGVLGVVLYVSLLVTCALKPCQTPAANPDFSQRLLRSGDISENPGPRIGEATQKDMAESSSGEPLRVELKGQGLADTVVTALIQYGLSSLQDLRFFTEKDFLHMEETHGLKPFQVEQLRCLQKKLSQQESQGGQAGSRPGILMQDVHVTVDTMHSHSSVFGVKSAVGAGEGGQAAVQASLSHSSLQVGTVESGSSVALQNISMAPSELREKLENLIAATKQEMKRNCEHGYVETPALQKVLDFLHKPGACLILGLPGHGKSSLALQAMARLASTENLIPVHLTEPSQWNWIPPPETRSSSVRQRGTGNEAEDSRNDKFAPPHSSTEDTDSPPSSNKCKLSHDREQGLLLCQSCETLAQNVGQRSGVSSPNKVKTYVALIDDSFGKGNFDQQKYDGWEDKFSHLEAKVKDGQVKLILVSRTHIYQNCKDSLVQDSLFTLTEKVDLCDRKLWTEECLESILKSFFSHHDVRLTISSWDMHKIWRSCQKVGFPQCCFYFVTNEQARKLGLNFFKKPFKFLRLQFQTM